MRIAIFSDNFYPELSGISDSIIETGKQLALRGHSVVFVAPEYDPENYSYIGLQKENPDLGPNVSFVRLPSFKYGGANGQGRIVMPLWRAQHRLPFRPEIVHVNLPFGVGMEGIMTAKRFRVPLVGTDHTPMKEFVRYSPIGGPLVEKIVVGFNAWFYRHCDFVSSPAQAIIDELRERGLAAVSQKVSNPIQVEEFSHIRDRVGLKQKFDLFPITVLYAGRLAPEKNVDLVIRAVAAASGQNPDIGLAILGRGPEEAKLRRLASDLGVEKKVRFLGFLDNRQLTEVYSASDMFAIMSTAETQCIAAMNALATGIPLLAADSLGLGEYARETRQILIPPGEIAILSAAITDLATKEEERVSLGEVGQKVVQKYSPENIAEEWEMIYQRTINRYAEKNSR